MTNLNNNIEKKLKRIFTEGQIKKLNEPQKKINWSEHDIAKAIVVYATGARSYKLFIKKGYPLPSIRTLQRWCQKVTMTKGILSPVMQIMRNAELSTVCKACVLSFDEMKVKATYCYDKANDMTLKPANYVQVAMIRGLFGNWKQSVFYDFDCRVTKELLFQIIAKVEECGFTIQAVVSDLVAGNRILHKELEVSHTQPWFINPMDSKRKIYFFADVPHLLKLARNHFIDKGFVPSDGVEVRKSILEKMLQHTSGELSITHKISPALLNVKGAERQKVKYAAKLFSHSTVMALHRTATHGHLQDENWLQCADIIKKFNDWFDIFNSRIPSSDSTERIKAFDLSVEVQTKILDEMTDLISDIRVIGSRTPLLFQKEIIQNNTAVKLLLDDLKNQYGTKNILTYRLNQDCLENFFSVIRSKGGLHDHPDQMEFQYRVRSYIVGHNEGAFVSSTNVVEDNTFDLFD